MDQHSSIAIEVSRNLMRVTLGGFFQISKLSEVARQLQQAREQLTCDRNKQLTLVDVRAMAIQPQESVLAFEQIIANPEFASERLAFVVPHTLLRMQVQRASSSREPAYFDRVEAAEQWLFAR
ncbi:MULTISPECIES: hypothetical protein [Alphaproteobacteria]|uniref:hypothetical protein n=1 Tax=Alphaproteobacteria TaxID=28211 RepID=UPI0026150762|nr:MULTISPECIES: hypothetical protein [Alphaproteobacteria]